MAMPALISALEDFVPTSNRGFLLAGARLELAESYFEGPFIDVLPLYFGEYYNRREREVAYTFSEVMHHRHKSAATEGYARVSKVDWHSFRRSDFYNLILRPAGMMQSACLKLSEGDQPLGILTLFRTEGEPTFSARDFAVLEALQSFLAHGLHQGASADDFVDTDDRALIIADRDGRPLHLSPAAQRLMLMALVPHWAPDSMKRSRLEQQPVLKSLCQSLTTTFAGRLPSLPPVLRRRNAWGEFVLRAYWLDAVDAEEPGRYVAISVERHEPRVLGLLRKIEALSLSQREKELCLWLARGRNTATAAAAMGVSESTIVTHRRSIYRKLVIDNRAALLDRLQRV